MPGLYGGEVVTVDEFGREVYLEMYVFIEDDGNTIEEVYKNGKLVEQKNYMISFDNEEVVLYHEESIYPRNGEKYTYRYNYDVGLINETIKTDVFTLEKLDYNAHHRIDDIIEHGRKKYR